MKQIWIVLRREYLNRIRKRSFVVLTLLGPVLSLCMLFIPIYLSMDTKERIHIWLQADKADRLQSEFSDDVFVIHPVETSDDNELQQQFLVTSEKADVLSIVSAKQQTITLWDKKGLSVREQFQLKNKLENIYREQSLLLLSPEQTKIPEITTVSLVTPEKNTDVLQLIGIFAALVSYFFIFYYGVQVMKGVVDEKSNRVVEVILCSVKPFYWMFGKILGIAAVCLTQFSIWVCMYLWIWNTFSTKYGAALTQFKDANIEQTMSHTSDVWQALEWNAIAQSFDLVPVTMILVSFFLFFLIGYLLYASLFAAVGAMTDNETDTQQFTFPITVPLFMTFLLSGFIISEPESGLSMFLSYFPLTSPVAMMLRIPMGIDTWEIIVSLSILILAFLSAVYAAAGIFKRGIIQYGRTLKLRDFLTKR